MTARILHPAITFISLIAVVIAAVAVYSYLTTGTTLAVGPVFAPTTSVKMCNAMPASFSSTDPDLSGNPSCTENLTPGVALGNVTGSPKNTTADVGFYTHLNYTVSDLNFSAVVTEAPATMLIKSTAGNAGFKVGGLLSNTDLGLINNPCTSNPVDVPFVLYTVDLPNVPSDPRTSTNIGYPRQQGQTDRFGDWAVGAPPASGNPDSISTSGSFDGNDADGTNIAFQNYPSYLLDTFDSDWTPTGDGPNKPLVPIAVYGGLHNYPPPNWIPLYFVQFAASTVLPAPLDIFNNVGASSLAGQPSVSVLNDPTVSAASPGSITDFCTGLDVQTSLLYWDTTDTFQRATNPTATGTSYFVQYNASQRDTDQDGFENQIDPCPVSTDAFNPKDQTGPDSDTDMIAGPGSGGCDTLSNPITNHNDQDTDKFANGGDNCPQAANGIDVVTNPASPVIIGPNDQADSEVGVNAPDHGPNVDGIGDVCDSEAGTITVVQNGGPSFTILMDDLVANGRYMTVTNVAPRCFGGTDADNDGYCTTEDNQDGVFVRHTAWFPAAAVTAGKPYLATDTDLDGWSDSLETYLGTDPAKPCAQSATGNNESPMDNWPPDFTDDTLVSGPDVLKYGTKNNLAHTSSPGTPGSDQDILFGSAVSKPAWVTVGYSYNVPTKRFDLNGDGIVNGPDVLILNAANLGKEFAKHCGSVLPTTVPAIPAWSQQ